MQVTFTAQDRRNKFNAYTAAQVAEYSASIATIAERRDTAQTDTLRDYWSMRHGQLVAEMGAFIASQAVYFASNM